MEHTKPTRSKKQMMPPMDFDLPVNGRNYAVSVTPFTNPAGEILYRISYDQGPVHIFGWDEGLDRYAETDVQEEIIPPVVELGIANTLNEFASQMEDAA